MRGQIFKCDIYQQFEFKKWKHFIKVLEFCCCCCCCCLEFNYCLRVVIIICLVMLYTFSNIWDMECDEHFHSNQVSNCPFFFDFLILENCEGTPCNVRMINLIQKKSVHIFTFFMMKRSVFSCVLNMLLYESDDWKRGSSVIII